MIDKQLALVFTARAVENPHPFLQLLEIFWLCRDGENGVKSLDRDESHKSRRGRALAVHHRVQLRQQHVHVRALGHEQRE